MKHAEITIKNTAQDFKCTDDCAWFDRAAIWEPRIAKTPLSGKRRPERPASLILSGHGVQLRIEHGALCVKNGFTHYPQKSEVFRMFPGDSRLPERIVALDCDGTLSFDVLTWLSAQEIPLIHINWRGEVVTVAGQGGRAADATILEAQVAGRSNGRGLELAAQLVREKLIASQATIRACIPPLAQKLPIAKIRREMRELDRPGVKAVETLRLIEGRAAIAYLYCWDSVLLQWIGTGRRPIPESWRSIGLRGSPVGEGNRNAIHPVNAMLNYAYGMLESQVRIAVVAAGLDPAIGYLHALRKGRISLVYDLMEPLRPLVDAKILQFVGSRKFSREDFTISSQGVCRVHPKLAGAIAALVSRLPEVHKVVSKAASQLR